MSLARYHIHITYDVGLLHVPT